MEKMVFDAEGLKQRASGEKKQHRQLFKKLKKINTGLLDTEINSLHDFHMGQMDCLSCTNCCKSISPAVNDRDIDRIAKYLKMKPRDVVSKYFLLDEDGDYVFPKQPCPFLGSDNYCAVYDARPKACREYPHTDRSRQHKILDLTYKNIRVCPVVFDIVQDLKKEFS